MALPGFESPAMHSVPIVQLIQLAVTPIFLLSGVGVILGVITNRLTQLGPSYGTPLTILGARLIKVGVNVTF